MSGSHHAYAVAPTLQEHMNYDAALMLLRHPSTMPRMKLVGPSSKCWRLYYKLLRQCMITCRAWYQQLELAAAHELQLISCNTPSALGVLTGMPAPTHFQHY